MLYKDLKCIFVINLIIGQSYNTNPSVETIYFNTVIVEGYTF